MRRLVLVSVICLLGLAAPAAARAQATTQAKPPAPPATPAQPAAPSAAEEEVSRSLFDPMPRQFEIGGRLSSVSGDPARWQRYQDLRDGVLLTGVRFEREGPDREWFFKGAADNVGYRDQRYAATYERTGRFVISGLWDEIPQFYSVDTKTPYTSDRSPLPLDDSAQRAAQTNPPGLNVWLPIATQFDLRERRDIGNVNFLATPTPQIDVRASFTTQRHVGQLPWGASFGFNNDVEVALPYNSRANDFTLGTEWTNKRSMLRVAYNGSWFDNIDDELVWDSPIRLDDSANPAAPGRGRMALWPSNSAQTISAAGYQKLAHRTQVTGFISYGAWSNNEPLQPFTINTALPQIALPRANSDLEARILSTNINLVSRPQTDWRFSARLRHYGYDNQSPHTSIPTFINYDTSTATSPTGGPELYAHDRTTFDADATWSGLQPVALTVGYTRNNTGHDFRIFESTGENVLRVTADAVGSQWVTFRAQYEHSDRTGDGLDEDLLIQIGEQPAMRHYDIADRSRNRFTGQVDVVPNDLWTFSASAGVGKDEFDDSYFGLQESSFKTFSLSADYRQANGFGGGASYNYERYSGDQRSREASPGQETNPLRDWTVNSKERVDYFSIYAWPPRISQNTEARLSYDYGHAKGDYLYAIAPGSPITPPNQLPQVFNKLQQLHLDVRHRLGTRLSANFSYLYEPFRVYDFAFDQTVVNSIVQPSSLVLGYVYRPYTAHSFVAALRYFW